MGTDLMETLLVMLMLGMTAGVLFVGGLAAGGGTVWRQSPESLRLAREIFELSGHSWDRVHRASEYRDGINYVDRAKLAELTYRETGIDLRKEEK